jgi:chromosome segregation ATPase
MPRASSTKDKPLTISFYEKNILPRFLRTDESFISMEERFDRIDESFSKIDERFSKIDEKFVKMDERFDRLENLMTDRFDFLFKRYEDFQQELTIITHQLKRMDAKLERLDELEVRLGKVQGVLQDHVDQLKDLRVGVTQLENQQAELVKAIQDKKSPGGGTTPSNEKIEQDISHLKQEILKINERVDELESQLPKPL